MQFKMVAMVSEKNRPKGDVKLSGNKIKMLHEVKVHQRTRRTGPNKKVNGKQVKYTRQLHV
jgi:hypothetical protein